jgi:hypothetical protein
MGQSCRQCYCRVQPDADFFIKSYELSHKTLIIKIGLIIKKKADWVDAWLTHRLLVLFILLLNFDVRVFPFLL